jgi:hypothetical protein
VPGPFHRLENPITQTTAIAKQQEISREIWGAAARNTAQSDLPCVKAYTNGLPAGRPGVEFDSHVNPTAGSNSPSEVRWYIPEAEARTVSGTDYAVISLSKFVNGQ